MRRSRNKVDSVQQIPVFLAGFIPQQRQIRLLVRVQLLPDGRFIPRPEGALIIEKTVADATVHQLHPDSFRRFFLQIPDALEGAELNVKTMTSMRSREFSLRFPEDREITPAS